VASMSKRPRENSDLTKHLALAQAVLAAPSVTVDGIRYWSDRFYLNHVESDPPPSSGGCTCGAKQPPPLLSRERLVQSLDVKAAILGTFTLDPNWLVESFPQLVGPNATVPTLILHGSKKFNKERRLAEEQDDDSDDDETSSFPSSARYESRQEQENSQPSVPSVDKLQTCVDPPKKGSNLSIPLVEFSSSRLSTIMTKEESCEESSSSQGAFSFQTQAQATERSSDQLTAAISLEQTPKNETKNGHPGQNIGVLSGARPSTVTPETAASTSSQAGMMNDLGKFCSATYVQSNWKKPKEAANSRVSYEPVATENEGSKDSSSSEFKRGVHHPKFMILFERSGDVVVSVSTANLTKTRTIEGTWVQRFPPNRRYQQQQQRIRQQPSVPRSKSPPPPPIKRNDFGLVLRDFLEKLDGSAAAGDPKIHDFVLEHFQFPLMELAQSFHFEKAQVHLVPVVPGDWENVATPTSKATAKKQVPISYGRQRVRDILQKETLVQSNKDRLIVQPTSFGGNWRQGEMADVVRSYLNVSQGGGDEDSIDYWDDDALLERMDIVWPSRTYIQNANRPCDSKEIWLPEHVENMPHKDTEPEASWVFLSSNTFNSCDRPCVSRLAHFQVSDPPQRLSTLVPHFKSIGRLVTDQSVIRKHGFESRSTAKEYLSWFLLTSACLSHGAQGKRIQDTDPFATVKEKVQYANFELGVLFTSRVQPREKRLYGFAPHQCSCQSLVDPQHKLIHLPIPYSLHPKPFLEEEDDPIMQETPFLHEIEDGTRCVGNMLLTPFGIREAKKQKIRSKQNDS
jgi:hypothetical protein